MAPKGIFTDVQINGNPVDILSLEVSEGYKQTCARFSLDTDDITGFDLNDVVTIDMGFDAAHGPIFQGYVDEITETRMPGTYSVEGRDVLKRAIEHFIVSTDIDHPWSRENIAAENLVRDLLSEAGIGAYVGAATAFTFGTSSPAEFNLMTSWDGIRLICNILAYTCFAENGVVYFKREFPVPVAPSTHSFDVGNAGDIVLIDYGYNPDNLRNKVVVFGKSGIYAERHEDDTPNPWPPPARKSFLPANFYKTAIVSSELIDLQSMADSSAQYNLELYNKLTEFIRLETIGDYLVRSRDTIDVTEPFTGMVADEWFIYSVSHRIDDSGYTMSLNLSR